MALNFLTMPTANKFATGTRFVNYQAYTGKKYMITGLKFRPKVVFVYDKNMYCKASVMDALKENYDIDDLPYDKIDMGYKQSECNVFVTEINDDGFQLDTSRSSNISMSGNVRWIAIG